MPPFAWSPSSGGGGGAPSGAAGGDLSGTYPNPTVPGLASKASLTQAATLQELIASMYTASTFSVASTFWVFTAPFPCKVTQFSLVSIFAAIAASDTNYWTIDLKRTTDNNTSAVIATKTTKVTGGAAMAQRADWNYDALTFSATNQQLSKGDILSVLMTPTGAPTALNGLLATARYEPT